MNNASFITQHASFAAGNGLCPNAELAESTVSNWHPFHHSKFITHNSPPSEGDSDMAFKSQRILLSPWERSGEGFHAKCENKETPAPVNREGLRKKCPGSTLNNRYNLPL
jgi:hypothetical protein